MKKSDNPFYSGTSGLVLPVVKALFPPEFLGKSRLTYYASLFNSVEINSSFYKLPMTSTVEKWAESVPHHFRFTFKLSKFVTHAKGLEFDVEDVNRFMRTISNIGNKKGSLLVQLPPALKIEKIRQLQNLLASIKDASGDTWKVAVEFRNLSWYHEEMYDLLNQFNTSLVIHDLPASATPLININDNFKYVRFHGTEKNYRGSYADDHLYKYAQYISSWIREGKTVYAYFNNTLGEALKNLHTLNSFVANANL